MEKNNNGELQQENLNLQENETWKSSTEVLIKPNDKWSNDVFDIIGEVKKWIYKTLNLDEYSYFKVSDMVWKSQWWYLLKSWDPWLNWEQILWDVHINWNPSTEFKTKWVVDDWKPIRKDVACMWNQWFTRDFKMYKLVDMNGIIELDNGKLLINRYGKYEPNLSFLNNVPEVNFQKVNRKELNFAEWDFSVLYWEFFISKKWTKCFRILPKEKAKHILICDSWWWAFDKYRWRTLPEDKATYYRRASSHWWWCWCDYWVYDVNFKNEVSEDDI